MNFNPLFDRYNRPLEHTPGEYESADPDPNLTITVVILCLVAPFWLIYRLVAYVATRFGMLAGWALQSKKKSA